MVLCKFKLDNRYMANYQMFSNNFEKPHLHNVTLQRKFHNKNCISTKHLYNKTLDFIPWTLLSVGKNVWHK